MQIKHISTMSLKEKQRQERVELIIQAAEAVLLEKGYYDTSMDDIANRVGIAKATIYPAFQGRKSWFWLFLRGICRSRYGRLGPSMVQLLGRRLSRLWNLYIQASLVGGLI